MPYLLRWQSLQASTSGCQKNSQAAIGLRDQSNANGDGIMTNSELIAEARRHNEYGSRLQASKLITALADALESAEEHEERIKELERRLRLSSGKFPCQQCGGPHPFDTSIPGHIWNKIIRPQGLPDYLCLTYCAFLCDNRPKFHRSIMERGI